MSAAALSAVMRLVEAHALVRDYIGGEAVGHADLARALQLLADYHRDAARGGGMTRKIEPFATESTVGQSVGPSLTLADMSAAVRELDDLPMTMPRHPTLADVMDLLAALRNGKPPPPFLPESLGVPLAFGELVIRPSKYLPPGTVPVPTVCGDYTISATDYAEATR